MDEKMVSLRINNIPVTVPAGTTVLEAARSAGFNIPSLCFLKDVNEIGACRICVVEVKGAKSLVASCVYPVAEGMEVFTNTERVRKSRQLTLELILSNHRMDCLTCARNSECELRQLASDLGIDAVRYASDNMYPQIEDSAPHLVRDNSKCVLCRRCKQVGFRKGVVRIEQWVGTIQHSLELTADAVIVDGCCEHQHIGIVHSGGNFHGIVLDDAVPQLQAGKAAFAE